MIRQVLQHLSNAQIDRILKKAKEKYRYLLVTERHPAERTSACPNMDIVHGAGHTAAIHESGVYPNLPPFSIGEYKVLLEMELPADHGARAAAAKIPSAKSYLAQAGENDNNDKLVSMLFRF